MSGSLGKKAFRSGISNTMMNMVNLVTGLLLTPFVMASLGDEQNGYWVIIKMVMGYYGFIDLGISFAVARFVAVAIGKRDQSASVRIVQVGMSMVLLMDLVFVVLSVVAALLIHQLAPAAQAVMINQLLLVVVVGMGLSLPGQVYRGVLTAKVRHDIIAAQTIFNNLIRAAAIYGVLRLGGNVLWLTAVSAVTLIALTVSYYFSARRQLEGIGKFRPCWDKVLWKDLLGYGVSFSLVSVGDIFRWSAAPMIAAVSSGAAFVTHLNIALALGKYGTSCAAGLFSVFMPVFGQLVGGGDPVRIKRVFYKAVNLTIPLAGLIFGGMIFFGDDFIKNWVGPEYLDATVALVCISIGLMVALMQNPIVTLMQGLGLAKWYAISNGIEAALNVLLCFMLRDLGMLGFGLAFMCPMLLIKLTLQPILILRATEWSIFEYYALFIRQVIICMCGVVLAGYISDHVIPDDQGWFTFLYKGMLYVLIYGPFTLWVTLRGASRNDLIKQVRQLFGSAE